MNVAEKQILKIVDLSQIIGRSERAIRIAQSRGQEGVTIPKSTKLGGRRVWLRSVVDDWIRELREKTVGNE